VDMAKPISGQTPFQPHWAPSTGQVLTPARAGARTPVCADPDKVPSSATARPAPRASKSCAHASDRRQSSKAPLAKQKKRAACRSCPSCTVLSAAKPTRT
jgi:hypothetical protein